jgi:hypothetical protein
VQLLVSVLAENWLQIRKTLRRGGAPPPGTVGSRSALSLSVVEKMRGRLLLVDWAERRITHHLPLPTPAGTCWSADDRILWVVSGRGETILGIDSRTWETQVSASHPGFHDLHSVTRLGNDLLITSAGTDAVFQVDLEGRLTRSWWAGQFDLTQTPSGRQRVLKVEDDHRGRLYPSLHRAVHPNGAVALDNGHWLVTCFHLGAVLDVHPDGHWSIWAKGFDHPHSLRPLTMREHPEARWLISDTLRGRVLALNEFGRTIAVLARDLRWVQDATWSSRGLIVLDNLHVGQGLRPKHGNCILQPAIGTRCELPANWRPVSVRVLSPNQVAACRRWEVFPATAHQNWTDHSCG